MSKTEGRILGIDYGSKRVGVSISDPLALIAQPVATLDNDASLLQRLCEIMREREVRRIVVGMPYSPDGGKGAKALEVEGFIARLRETSSVPIDTWDESYSSVNAQRAMRDSGMKRKKRQQKARVDVMAARLLLQEYLDHHQDVERNG